MDTVTTPAVVVNVTQAGADPARLTALETQVASLAAALTAITASDANLQQHVAALEARDATTKQMISDLQKAVASAPDADPALAAQVAAIQAHLDADIGRIDAIDNIPAQPVSGQAPGTGPAAVAGQPPAGTG